jgi:hypothetical protein
MPINALNIKLLLYERKLTDGVMGIIRENFSKAAIFN